MGGPCEGAIRGLGSARRVGGRAAVLFAAAGLFTSGEGHGQVNEAPLFHRGAVPVDVGAPAPGTGQGRAQDCAACHVEIAREWAQSQHRTAWTDAVFLRAYEVEPMPFCRHCHAPLAPRGQLPQGLAASDGVSCAVCHVRDGVVRSSGRGRGDAPGARVPHPVVADARFETSAYCGGCHQFNFPIERVMGGVLFDSHRPMQDTLGEWARSRSAREGSLERCADCHMPLRVSAAGRPYRSHDFAGARDPALLASAVQLVASAARDVGDPTRVTARVQVRPARLGHAFPTGDLFRRLELRVWPEGDAARAQVVSFARVFEDRFEALENGEHAFVRREVLDARVAPPGDGEPQTHELVFERVSPGSSRVLYRLEHLLMPSPQAASQGFSEAQVRSLVADGACTIAVPPLATHTTGVRR